MYNRPSSQTEIWDQYYLFNYDYYGHNHNDFGSATTYYNTLKNVVKMEEKAKNSGLPTSNAYTALVWFLELIFYKNELTVKPSRKKTNPMIPMRIESIHKNFLPVTIEMAAIAMAT